MLELSDVIMAVRLSPQCLRARFREGLGGGARWRQGPCWVPHSDGPVTALLILEPRHRPRAKVKALVVNENIWKEQNRGKAKLL